MSDQEAAALVAADLSRVWALLGLEEEDEDCWESDRKSWADTAAEYRMDRGDRPSLAGRSRANRSALRGRRCKPPSSFCSKKTPLSCGAGSVGIARPSVRRFCGISNNRREAGAMATEEDMLNVVRLFVEEDERREAVRAQPDTKPTVPFQWLDMSNWDNEPRPQREWAI